MDKNIPSFNEFFRQYVTQKYGNASSSQKKQLTDYLDQMQMQENAQKFAEAGVKPADVPTNDLGTQVLLNQINSGAYKPESESEGLTGDRANLFKMARNAGEDALRLLQSGDVQTGPLTTPLQYLQEMLPGSEATMGTDYRSKLAMAKTALRTAFLGGQITSGELKSLQDALPSPYTQEVKSGQQLLSFMEELDKVLGNKGSTSQSQMDISDEELINKYKPK